MNAHANVTLLDGNNTFTAVAEDALGRKDTNSVTAHLPASPAYTYDARGNLVSDGRRGFDYDDENQLVRVTMTNGWKSEFAYDGMMRRRVRQEFTWTGSAWLLTNEVRYVYDGRLVVQERNGGNLPLVTYTRGNDLSGTRETAGGIGGMLARTDNARLLVSSAGAHAYYHADGNGNVTALVNDNQLLVASYQYDPYGNLLASKGPLAAANLYRFSSKEVHANSGLVYYLYRYYEPSLQRWMNRDPIGDIASLWLVTSDVASPVESGNEGETAADELLNAWIDINRNLYGVGSDPVNLLDAFGLSPCSEFVDSIIDDFTKFPAPLELGKDWLNKRNTTLKDTVGFKENLVGGGQGGAVSRHIYGHGGALMYGQSSVGISPAGYAASYIQQGLDYIQRFNEGRTKAESRAEIAGNKAGRAVANALRDAYRKGKDKADLDKLREKINEILCD
jgi:RHS repeat-associated protein